MTALLFSLHIFAYITLVSFTDPPLIGSNIDKIDVWTGIGLIASDYDGEKETFIDSHIF